jgi:hypothetical protein
MNAPGLNELRWRSALLEGFAVLLGILAAFSIDAWWDLRSEQQDRRSYLVAITTELEANRELVLEDIRSLDAWIEQGKGFLDEVVAVGANPSYDEVRNMVWETGPNQTTPLLRAAVDDLVSSGGISLIESAELRRSIARYVRALDRDADEQEDVRLNFQQFVLPYHIDHVSFADYDWEQAIGVEESDTSFDLDFDAFVENRDYANRLVSRILGYSNLRETHGNVLVAIEETLQLLEISTIP